MKRDDDYLYMNFNEKGFQCVKIPYKDWDFSMLVILPHKRFGVEDVINELDVKTIEKLKDDEQFWQEWIYLEMPKFKIEYEASLNKSLQSLGIKDAFDEENADFSAMFLQSSGLYVTEVVHKAFIETNEEGTEAAAATRVRMGCFSSGFLSRPIYFTVDHPFLFMIMYKSKTLFMGKVSSLWVFMDSYIFVNV